MVSEGEEAETAVGTGGVTAASSSFSRTPGVDVSGTGCGPSSESVSDRED